MPTSSRSSRRRVTACAAWAGSRPRAATRTRGSCSGGTSARSCSISRPTPATTRCSGSPSDADVLVENFRPGTLERLGLGPDVLLARNPRLVVLRVTGFGQDGPYASRPGFATMAEAMSGFAAINGEPDGPPLLPPIALTDEVAALAGAFAVMVALRERDRERRGPGHRRQPAGVDAPDDVGASRRPPRTSATSSRGSVPASRTRCRAAPTGAPTAGGSRSRRRPSRSHTGCWSCSVSATTRGSRRSRAAPRTARSSTGRSPRGSAARPSDDVLAAFEPPQAAIAPVYSMRDLLADPHVRRARSVRRGRRRGHAGARRPVVAHAGRGALGRPPARRRHGGGARARRDARERETQDRGKREGR